MSAPSTVSEDEFNLLLGLLLSEPAALFLLKDTEHRYTFAKGQVYGVLPDSLAGGAHSLWLTPDCVQEITAKDWLCMSSGSASLQIDTFHTIDGRNFECRSLRYPYRDESGRIIGMGLVAVPYRSSDAIDPRALAAEIQSAKGAMRIKAVVSTNAASVSAIEDMDLQPSTSIQNSTSSWKWRKAYESGNALIDSQHRELLAQSIEIQKNLKSDNDESTLQQISTLASAIVQHFKDEIQILHEAGFPDVKEHEILHEEEVNAVVDAIRKTESGEMSARDLVHFVIARTLIKHMVTADMAFFPFLQQQSNTKNNA